MMFKRMRNLLRSPLVAPERRGRLARLAPKVCALVVYAVFVIALFLAPAPRGVTVFLGPVPWDKRKIMEWVLRYTLPAAYLAAGFLLFVVPLGLAAAAFARERDRGTMDALVLTPFDHRRLVWARFWRVVLPWLRFMLWLAPLYVLMAGSGFVREAVNFSEISIFIFVPKGFFCWILNEEISYFHLTWGGLALAFFRAVNDLSILFFVVGASLCISTRAKSAARAFVWSYLAVPFIAGSVLALDFWWGVAAINIRDFWGSWSERFAEVIYSFLAISLMLARWLLAFGLAGRAARNFDAYATGERPARIRWRRLAAKAAAIAIIAGAIAYALNPRIRENASAMNCASYLRQIGLAGLQYARDHGGVMPPSFTALYPDYVGDPKCFSCPSNPSRWQDIQKTGKVSAANTSYIYVSGLRATDGPKCVLAFDRPENHEREGCNILFLDAHVEWILADGYREHLDRTRKLIASKGRKIRLLYLTVPPPSPPPRRWPYWLGGGVFAAAAALLLLWRRRRKRRLRAAA